MKLRYFTFALTVVAAALWALPCSGQEIKHRTDGIEYRFPADAGIVNVRDFGARGDGIADDTAAIQEAIRKVLRGSYRNPNFVYFPNGTYRITGPLRARVNDEPDGKGGWSDGWRSGMVLVGQSRDGTIVKLSDNTPRFDNKDKPLAMVIFGSTGHGAGHDNRIGGFGNEAFQNNMMNMTIDAGRDNPGAIGVDFLASNRGMMDEVTVRGQGHTGIDMTRAWPGPGLIKNVWIDGFDYGIRQSSMDCSMTFEHITLSNQRIAGIHGYQHPFMSLRGIVSYNAVPAFNIQGGAAIITILDSRLVYTGKGDAPAAMEVEGYLTLKGVEVEGYPVALAAWGKREAMAPAVDFRQSAGKGRIALFSSREPFRLHDGPKEVPDLAVKETPVFHHNNFSKWAKPQDFAAGSRTAGIQEAIDSGAEIVYLPNGSYPISETIVIRGAVRKIMGLEAKIVRDRGVESIDPIIRFDGTDGPFVVLEHMGHGVVEHNSDKTLVMRKCDFSYRNTARGTGDVFLEDGMFGRPKVLYPQNFWARQLNSEFGETPQFENHGGRAWILGMKVEGWPSAILNVGGLTECYGLYTMLGSGDQGKARDAFVENREGWLAVPFRVGGQGNYRTKVKDTWNNQSKQDDNWKREYPLVIAGQAFDAQEGPPQQPADARGNAVSSTEVQLAWQAADKSTLPLRGYRIDRDDAIIAIVPADTLQFTDTRAAELTDYRYRIRAMNVRGGLSDAATIQVKTPADTKPPAVLSAKVDTRHSTAVIVDFDEPVAADAALKVANYRLEPEARIVKARINPEGTRVVLTTASPLDDGKTFKLTATGLKDRSRAANTLDQALASASFTVWQEGDGLLAQFWNGKSFEGKPVAERVDRRVDYWWGEGSPAPGVEPKAFVARWSGTLRPRVSGTYRFQTGVRTGCRIFLDGKQVHDPWNAPRNEWIHSNPVELEAGRRYRLVFEMHATDHAGARLKWEGPVKNEFIDEQYLFSDKPAQP